MLTRVWADRRAIEHNQAAGRVAAPPIVIDQGGERRSVYSVVIIGPSRLVCSATAPHVFLETEAELSTDGDLVDSDSERETGQVVGGGVVEQQGPELAAHHDRQHGAQAATAAPRDREPDAVDPDDA